jgi:phosphoglycerate dehydrogenase-like enzyme
MGGEPIGVRESYYIFLTFDEVLSMVKGLYVLDSGACDLIYGPDERARIAELIDVYAPVQNADVAKSNPRVLQDVEVIMSGWGAPLMDNEFLSLAPNLRAVFYGAGSIRYFTTEALWNKGVRVTSAYAANAVPVAEFTLSQILFCLKCGWQLSQAYKRDTTAYHDRSAMKGAYGSTVGLISLGMVGRHVCQLLRPFDVNIIAFDPFISRAEADSLNVRLYTLDEVFANADVVSLHTPLLPETVGMITGRHLASMKDHSSFINTSRGAVVRENELVEVLSKRPDLHAVLDVTDPEPPQPGSPLLSLPNVTLTPHIAGSLAGECRRMGRYMLEELHRYLNGEHLLWGIGRERAKTLA